MLFPKSRACATSVCEWGGGGEKKKPETAFTTSLHIVMRMRRGENEQRKPDLRGESELDRQSSFFFSVDIYNEDAETLLSFMQKQLFFYAMKAPEKARDGGGASGRLLVHFFSDFKYNIDSELIHKLFLYFTKVS